MRGIAKLYTTEIRADENVLITTIIPGDSVRERFLWPTQLIPLL